MQYDSRDRLIISQVAVKAAIELASAERIEYEGVGSTAVELQELIFVLAETPHGEAPVTAPAAVAPLAAVIQHPSMANVPPVVADTFAAPSGQAPFDMGQVPPAQPIGAESPEEILWADALFHNPNDWFNNYGDAQAKSGGGKGPDFKHRRIKKGQYNLGLWVDGKTTPGFVPARLGTV